MQIAGLAKALLALLIFRQLKLTAMKLLQGGFSLGLSALVFEL